MPARFVTRAKRRVLMLGDDPISDASVGNCSQADGYEIVYTTDQERAVEASSTGDIDALVLDSELPSKDLGQLVARLNAGGRRCRILVIARTLEQMALANEAGADAVLMRPLDPKCVGMVMNNLLSRVPARKMNERGLPADPLSLFLNPDW